MSKKVDGDQFSLICQNANKFKGATNLAAVNEYMERNKADLYAFQEYPIRGKNFTSAFCSEGYRLECGREMDEAVEVWNSLYPWAPFPSRYWSESLVEFGGNEILIINIHVSCSDSNSIRRALLNRLQLCADRMVILCGDFNAAFDNQTENAIASNDLFLNLITADDVFREWYGKGETTKNPHYTLAYLHSDGKWRKKKLDHVFLSRSMRDGLFRINLEFLDDENKNREQLDGKKPEYSFSDHSGLMLTVRAAG